MAKRMPIVIDAEPVYVDSVTPLSQMVSPNVQSVTTNAGKIIPRDLFASTHAQDVAEGFDTQTATVNMGGAFDWLKASAKGAQLPVVIDAEPRLVDPQTNLSQLVPANVRSVTTNAGKIIPRALFDSTRAADVAEGFDTQTATVNMGAEYGLSQRDRMRLLQNEQSMLDHWLAGFEPCAAGLRGSRVDADGQLLFVGHFPLPDHYHPDHIHLAVYTEFYPNRAPIGVYLMDNREHRSAIARIRTALNVFNDTAYHGAEPPIQGFAWVCMYTEGWEVNLRHPNRGQTIQKFLAYFYALLASKA